MTQAEIKQLIQKQRTFFHSDATLDVEYRIHALQKLKACILKYENEILSINADNAFQDGLNEAQGLYAEQVKAEIKDS